MRGLEHGFSRFVAIASLLYVAGYILIIVGGPIASNDFWWHLELGERYWAEGLWLDSDPLVFTSEGQLSDPHSWLYDVGIFAWNNVLGLAGLRALHVFAVLLVIYLAYSILERAGKSSILASLATILFLLLAWFRLLQMRPELFSILVTFIVYRLILEPGREISKGRLIAFFVLMAIWANSHALVTLGLCLLFAGLMGHVAREILERWIPDRSQRSMPTHALKRVAMALGLGALAECINPRGLGQLSAFFKASDSRALWRIRDEWTAFNPFAWDRDPGGMSYLTWMVTDVLLLLFVVSAGVVLWQFLRRPTERNLERIDPVLMALGLASIAAIFVSGRFLWLLFFVVLYLVHLIRMLPDQREGANVLRARVSVSLALALCLAIPMYVSTRSVVSTLLPRHSSYLATDYDGCINHVEGVRFLKESGVTGNVFNPYWMGGFLGHWVGPELKTFVDGRLVFSDEVLDEYFAINAMKRRIPGESFVDVLNRRTVDFFFGVDAPLAVPAKGRRVYTTAHLEGHDGWLVVSRSLHHAIYLRRNVRNQQNLQRIENYYQSKGIPFDPERGLDTSEVIRADLDFAIEAGMVPQKYLRLVELSRGGKPEQRLKALNRLGLIYSQLGLYSRQIAIDEEAISLQWQSRPPRRRIINALLRQGHYEKALAAAEELQRVDPKNKQFLLTAKAAVASLEKSQSETISRPSLETRIQRLPVTDPATMRGLKQSFNCRSRAVDPGIGNRVLQDFVWVDCRESG